MQLPIRSITSVGFSIAVAVGSLGSACQSSDSCGPDSSAQAFGLTATGTNVDLAYGDFISSQNNDCPDPNAPTGLVSLTVTGMEMSTTGLVTLCIPRPDELEISSVPFGNNTGVEVIDFTGADDSCQYELDDTVTPTGTVAASGMCNDGDDGAGYSLTFHGQLALTATCGSGAPMSVTVTIGGDVSVSRASDK